MTTNINNLNINFTKQGSKKNVILIHGWGLNLNYFNNLINDLKDNYTVYAIDLPGFGKSQMPDKYYSTSNYANILLEFIKKYKIDSPTLIGHSFGGKVIIDLITDKCYNPNKVILIDSAGIRKKLSIVKKYKLYSYKFLKKIIISLYNKERANYLLDDLRKKYGSKDYKNCNDILRGSLVKIVNEDYKNKLYKIKCPTLLIWGSNDTDTPLKDGKIMNKEIRNSGLVIIKDANHFPIDTNYQECLIIIKNFLEN